MDWRSVLWALLLWLYKHILVIVSRLLRSGRDATTTNINHPKHTLINIPMILLSNTTIIPQSNSTLSSSYLLSFSYFPTDIINRCLIYIKLIFLYIIILWSGFVQFGADVIVETYMVYMCLDLLDLDYFYTLYCHVLHVLDLVVDI